MFLRRRRVSCVSMVVFDGLVPIRRQAIWSYHDDTDRSAYIRHPQRNGMVSLNSLQSFNPADLQPVSW